MKKIRNLKFLVLLITLGVLITTTVLVSYAYMPNNQSFPTTKEGEIGKIYWKFDTDTLYLNNTQVDATYALIDENDINTSTSIDDKRPWKDVKDIIVNVNIENNIKPTTTYKWFYNFKKLNSIINVNNLDMSNVTNKEYMFSGCTNLQVKNILDFNILEINQAPLIMLKGFNQENITNGKFKLIEVNFNDVIDKYEEVLGGHSFIQDLNVINSLDNAFIGRDYRIEQVSSDNLHIPTNDVFYIRIDFDNSIGIYLYQLNPKFNSFFYSDSELPSKYNRNIQIENSGYIIFNTLETAEKDVKSNPFKYQNIHSLYIKENINKESYYYIKYSIKNLELKVELDVAFPKQIEYFDVLYVFNYKKEIPTSEINIIKKNGLGQILPGAELIITTLDGTQVDKWISDNKAHTLKLEDGDYIIKELKAPDGYILNKEEIKFTIKDQKIIKIDSNRLVSNNKNEITIKNEQINEENPETGNFISYNFIILSLIGLLIFGYYLKNKRNIFVK